MSSLRFVTVCHPTRKVTPLCVIAPLGPSGPPCSAAPLSSAGRAAARLSGLLVLTVTLVAAAGIVFVVHGQTASASELRLAANTRTAAPAGTTAASSTAGRGGSSAVPTQAPVAGAPGATGAAPQAGAGTTPGASGAPAANGQPGGGGHGDHRRENPQPAAPPNPNCTLLVPAAPTSATGLATPYRLVATDPRAGACHETNADQSAFVEAAIIQPDTGQISVYHPLVVDDGAQPAAAPGPVTLPPGAVAAVWFGFNGDTLKLAGDGAQSCVNGLPGSPFGQFAYCNAPAFFQAAQSAIAAGKLTVPALGTGKDGLPCPTTRDFSVVDQDQSDNLATAYRVVNGQVGQDTAATRAGAKLTNGSDEGLLAKAIDPALGCSPWVAPDLTDPGANSPALALNELSAAAHQAASGPEALVPESDPMVLVDGRMSTEKTNLYRAGVNMPPLPAGQTPQQYCQDLHMIAVQRLMQDATLLAAAPSPAPSADNLLDFLRNRLQASFGNLNCPDAQQH